MFLGKGLGFYVWEELLERSKKVVVDCFGLGISDRLGFLNMDVFFFKFRSF